MENKEIDLELLLRLDLDVYTEWVLKKKSITRQKKKEMVFSLMDGKEKTISNYKSSIEEIFIKTKYWKEPSEDQKVFFSEWRKSEFEKEVDFYNYLTEGNPLPFNEIQTLETKRIVNKLNSVYSHLIPYIINRWLTEEYFNLACFVGIIDYLKWLYRTPMPKDLNHPLNISIPQIALIQIYEGKTITRENAGEEIKKYGHNSGDSLYNKYTYYFKKSNRLGLEDTKKKNLNKLELLESILTFLSEKAKNKALDEISIFKSALLSENQ